jgi:hypothetical protein
VSFAPFAFCGQKKQGENREKRKVMERQKLFSICHTTARPEGWQESFGAWCARASRKWTSGEWALEYVLCVDRRWGFTPELVQDFKRLASSEYPDIVFRVVWNNARKCSVDGWNTAASASTGNILILNADDFYPPQDWDIELERVSCYGPGSNGYQPEFVIHVSSGIEVHDEAGLMTLGIMSRALYERWGYALYPGYESVRSDDDFSDHAQFDGVVIDARHLVFEHRHPAWLRTNFKVVEIGDCDQVYQHQNRDLSYAEGLRLLKARRANEFRDTQRPRPKVIGACLPGRDFSMQWSMCWHVLQAEILGHGFGLWDTWAYCNNIYFTRMILHKQVMATLEKLDFVLWIDSDNLIDWSTVAKMIDTLEAYPDVSMVAGWYYLSAEGSDLNDMPVAWASSGRWVDGHCSPFSFEELAEAEQAGGFLEADYSGFGCVLMRADALRLTGERPSPFLPRFSNAFEWGMSGDDVAFCLTLKERGGKILCDPRLRVEHLKRMPVRPPAPKTILPEPTGQLEERTVANL